MSKENNSIVKVSTSQSKTYDLYLVDGVSGTIESYIPLFQALRDATQYDKVNLYINNYGGSIATAIQIIQAMEDCEAEITGFLDGMCHSAATIILLACDSWQINSMSIMLIHNYSGYSYGKGKELMMSAEAQDQWVDLIFRRMYDGFLTEQEIDRVRDDKDMWLFADDIEKRLHSVLEYRSLLQEDHDNRKREHLIAQVEKIKQDHKNETSSSTGVETSPT